MKKTIDNKLTLNKETISNLGHRELQEIIGGSQIKITCGGFTCGYECQIQSINVCIEPSRDCPTTTN